MIANDRRSMNHAELVISRQAVDEGRGLVVVVNKMDLLKGRKNSKLYDDVIKAVPEEIQTVIPQEDFDMGRIPIRILQRCIARNKDDSSSGSNTTCRKKGHGKKVETNPSTKRTEFV